MSSPSDVRPERERVDLVAARLNTELDGVANIQVLRWERSFYSANTSFQQAIDSAIAGMTDTDIVVVVVWKRVGLELNPDIYHRPDMTAYEGGTVYEFETAMEVSRRQQGVPDVYLCRKGAPILYEAAAVEEQKRQHELLEAVWKRWTQTDKGHNTAGYINFDDADDFEKKIELCLRQWLQRKGVLLESSVWHRKLKGSPFCGLTAFGADHARVFFGRDADIARAAAKFRKAGEAGTPFLVVVGASGTGKSSFVSAGLAPRLILPGSIGHVEHWRLAVTAPSGDPLQSLARAMFAGGAIEAELTADKWTPRALESQLQADADVAVMPIERALERVAAEEAAKLELSEPRAARLLLVLDQTERMFVEASHDAIARFARSIRLLVERGIAAVLVVLRSDAFPAFQGIEDFAALLNKGETYNLLPPAEAELEEMVVRPVAACQPALAFERDPNGRSLAEVLVRDAKGGDVLPLLQVTLQRLYEAEQERGDGILQFADYSGIETAVATAAEEAFGKLDDDARNELPDLITALVREVRQDLQNGADAPVVVPLDRLPFEQVGVPRKTLIDGFVEARLLTAEQDMDLRVRIRPVHDALLRTWPRAARIIAERSALIGVRHLLEPMVGAWLRAEAATRDDYLATSPALLAGAVQLVDELGDDITADMRSYVARSAALAERRREAERRRQRYILAAVVMGLAIVSVLAALAGWQWQLAKDRGNETLVAQSRLLAAASTGLSGAGDHTAGMLVALEALPDRAHGVERPQVPEALRALYGGFHGRRELEIVAADWAVDDFAISADGRRLLTGLHSETAELWDLESRTKLVSVGGHDPWVEQVMFNPNGAQFLTLDSNGNVRIWDLATLSEVRRIVRDRDGRVAGCAFSPDGRLLAVTGDRIAVLDTTDWKTVAVLPKPRSSGGGYVSFNSDGSLLATETGVWTTKDWTLLSVLEHEDEFAHSLTFSPDSKSLVMSTAGSGMAPMPSAKTFDVETGKLEATFAGHLTNVRDADVRNAAFSPDGHFLLLAGSDGVRVWDLATKGLKFLLHDGVFINRAAYSSDGRWIATAGEDKTARLYDASSGRLVATLAGHTGGLSRIAFASHDQRILTSSSDGTVQAGEAGKVQPGPKAFPLAHVATPAGELHVLAWDPREAHTVLLWDWQSGRMLDTVPDQNAEPLAAVLDPQAARIVRLFFRAADGTGYLWDRESGRRTGVPTGDARTPGAHAAAGLAGAADFSPDGAELVIASGNPRMVDGRSGKLLFELKGHAGTALHAAFSPDGKLVATTFEDGSAIVFDAKTGSRISQIRDGPIDFVTFDRSAKRVATTSARGKARIWEAVTGRRLVELEGSGVDRIRFGGQSGLIAGVGTADQSGDAFVWDAATGKSVAVIASVDPGEAFYEDPRVMDEVAFAPSDSGIIAYRDANEARLWPLYDVRQLIEVAKDAAPRCLAPSRRVALGLAPKPPRWCITGGGREDEKDPTKWRGKWPYEAAAWRDWLAASDRGGSVEMPGADK